jgi:acetylornithine deacetylase/succinyl-diaminopimelate desuccinylase-like protein
MASHPSEPAGRPVVPAEDRVVDLCVDLLRLDTTNPGDGSGPGERAAAEHVAAILADCGLDPAVTESEPGRASVVARWPGSDPGRAGLLLHGHLDVVPAVRADWSVDPFAAEVRDGYLWGRGTVDMKGTDAMILAVVQEMTSRGEAPARDVVLAFTADEEAGGLHGARHLVERHRGAFDGVSDAVSEVGGFSVTVDDRRLYLLQTAEKGILWLRLVARGAPGHGSLVHPDSAVTRLAAAVARIGAHPWPVTPTPTFRAMAERWQELTGRPLPEDDAGLAAELGPTAAWVRATLRNTANPTVLSAGYKHNVVPGEATALVDCRFLPGQEEAVLDAVRELAGPGVEVEVVHRDRALEQDPRDGLRTGLPALMAEVLRAEDPGAEVLPYCLSGGTDNKHFDRLGIRGYGFAPLRLPPDLDFASLFHGVDERVPLDALRFGTRVLDRLLRTC